MLQCQRGEVAARLLFSEDCHEHSVLVVECDPLTICHEIAQASLKLLRKQVSVMSLPEVTSCTSGDAVDVMRVALTTISITQNARTDLIIVPNLYDAIVTNKSLPANLSALKCAKGRRIVYIIDARDRDARHALLRRDFIRTLGPIIWEWWSNDAALKRPVKDREKAIKAYVDGLDAKEPANAFLEEGCEYRESTDPWTSYENLGTSMRQSHTPCSFVETIRMFVASSALDKLSSVRDYYALTCLAEDMRESAVTVNTTVATSAEGSSLKKSTQLFTRCGLHGNLAREMLVECATCTMIPADLFAIAHSTHRQKAVNILGTKTLNQKNP